MFRISIAVILALAAAKVALADESDPACTDSYDRITADAQKEWPLAEPYALPPDWVSYFVRGYNDQSDRARDLEADVIVIYPVEEDYVFVFAFLEGCLSLYVDLTPQKTYHLMELGHALIRDETL